MSVATNHGCSGCRLVEDISNFTTLKGSLTLLGEFEPFGMKKHGFKVTLYDAFSL